MRFDFLRDVSSTAVGLLSGGIAGTLIKKLAIRPDHTFTTKFIGGAFSALLGGPGGVAAFLLAEPGREAKTAVADARRDVVGGRYA